MQLAAYCLNFHGRVTRPSVKNFQVLLRRQSRTCTWKTNWHCCKLAYHHSYLWSDFSDKLSISSNRPYPNPASFLGSQLVADSDKDSVVLQFGKVRISWTTAEPKSSLSVKARRTKVECIMKLMSQATSATEWRLELCRWAEIFSAWTTGTRCLPYKYVLNSDVKHICFVRRIRIILYGQRNRLAALFRRGGTTRLALSTQVWRL